MADEQMYLRGIVFNFHVFHPLTEVDCNGRKSSTSVEALSYPRLFSKWVLKPLERQILMSHGSL